MPIIIFWMSAQAMFSSAAIILHLPDLSFISLGISIAQLMFITTMTFKS